VVRIGEAFYELKRKGLNERAIVVLVADASGVNKSTVTRVLSLPGSVTRGITAARDGDGRPARERSRLRQLRSRKKRTFSPAQRDAAKQPMKGMWVKRKKGAKERVTTPELAACVPQSGMGTVFTGYVQRTEARLPTTRSN
jgi:hypothetical protein